MAIKFIVARMEEGNYNNYLGFSLKKINTMSCDLFNDPNQPTNGLSQKYNKGIEAYISAKLDDQDIVCFAHEDMKVLDPNFCQKLEKTFSFKPKVGLVGVAGATELPEDCNWFMIDPSKIKGHWLQDQSSQTLHMTKNNIGFFNNCVVIQKFFFAVRGELLNQGLRFDETFIGGDLYNIDFCLQVLERGYQVAVADIFLQHRSSRESNTNINILVSKYKEKGKKFPITADQFRLTNVEDQAVEVEI